MFRPLGLLSHIPCPTLQSTQPQDSCEATRNECPFGHAAAKSTQSVAAASPSGAIPTPASESTATPTSASTTGSASASASESASARPPPAKRARVDLGEKVNAYDASKRAPEAGTVDKSTAHAHTEGATSPSSAMSGHAGGEAAQEAPWTVVSRGKNEPAPPSTSSSSSSSSSKITHNRPPIVLSHAHPQKSAISLSSRNSALQTLWNEYTAAYAPLIDATHAVLRQAGRRLAFEDAIAEEKDIFSKASKHSYRGSIVTAATGIRKRSAEAITRAAEEADPAPATTSADGSADGGSDLTAVVDGLRAHCPEIGTSANVKFKREALSHRAKTMLTREKLIQNYFVCPRERLAEYGYDVVPEDKASIDDAWGPGGSRPDAVGEKRECGRCGRLFVVGGPLGEDGTRLGQDERACHYHWGKKKFQLDPMSGSHARIQVWLCCGRAVDSTSAAPSLSVLAGYGGPSVRVEGDETCCVGPHVFKEEAVEDLHQREAFVTTEELAADDDGSVVEDIKTASQGPLPIAAMDCELGYTTAGMSLTRVTVLDESGTIAFDELVKPRAEIIDPNLRFSGVSKAQLSSPTLPDLPTVRRRISRLIGSDTILIGHGLENDIRALRLLHSTLVDTSLLFPHPRGLPYRQSLKFLSARYLQRSIQEGGANVGHSSVEDAKASLDLVRWKIINEPRTPWTPDTLHIARSPPASPQMESRALPGSPPRQNAQLQPESPRRNSVVVISRGGSGGGAGGGGNTTAGARRLSVGGGDAGAGAGAGGGAAAAAASPPTQPTALPAAGAGAAASQRTGPPMPSSAAVPAPRPRPTLFIPKRRN